MTIANASALEGFEEVEHTADWAYRVWSASWQGLFIQSARGLYHLAGLQLAAGPSRERELELRAIDPESLLVAWLNELLHLRESENLGGDCFEIHQLDLGTPATLQAKVVGRPVRQWRKDIKAATYHNIAIVTTETGLEVTIVLDV